MLDASVNVDDYIMSLRAPSKTRGVAISKRSINESVIPNVGHGLPLLTKEGLGEVSAIVSHPSVFAKNEDTSPS